MFRSKDGVALQPEATGRVVGRLAIGIPLSVLPLPVEDIQLSSDVKNWRVMLFVIRDTPPAYVSLASGSTRPVPTAPAVAHRGSVEAGCAALRGFLRGGNAVVAFLRHLDQFPLPPPISFSTYLPQPFLARLRLPLLNQRQK